MEYEPIPVGERQRYAFVAIIALSVWLFISPFVVGYTHQHGSLWNSIMVALLSAFFVGLRVSGTRWIWPTVLNALAGIWLIVSPWVFGDTGNTGLLINNIVVGALLLIMAGWAIMDSMPERATH